MEGDGCYFAFHNTIITNGEPLQTAMADIAFSLDHSHTGLSGNRKIILWGQDDLMMTAVRSLLEAETGWEVSDIPDTWGDDAVIREVKRVSPHILIMSQNTFLTRTSVLALLAQAYSKIKIVTISLQENRLEIYDKQTVCINKASDLVSAIGQETEQTPNGGNLKNPEMSSTPEILPHRNGWELSIQKRS